MVEGINSNIDSIKHPPAIGYKFAGTCNPTCLDTILVTNPNNGVKS